LKPVDEKKSRSVVRNTYKYHRRIKPTSLDRNDINNVYISGSHYNGVVIHEMES